MPTDNLKPISQFPVYFQFPLERGKGKYLLDTRDTREEVKAIARKYRAFLRSVKQYPLSRLAQQLTLCDVGTKIRKLDVDHWAVYVIVNRKLNIELAIAENGR